MDHFRTKKIYYEKPFSYKEKTLFAKREPSIIALERSIAYPESGGQMGDSGVIRQGSLEMKFFDTQKVIGKGRQIIRQDFPLIHVEEEIRLYLEEPIPEGFDESQLIEVEIEKDKRAQLTRSHSAAHVLYMALGEIHADLIVSTIGCSIREGGGRFDFRGKISADDLVIAAKRVADIVESCHEIRIESLGGEPECRFWVVEGVRIPCGGTHLNNTSQVGRLNLKRKNIGKGCVRISYLLEELS